MQMGRKTPDAYHGLRTTGFVRRQPVPGRYTQTRRLTGPTDPDGRHGPPGWRGGRHVAFSRARTSCSSLRFCRWLQLLGARTHLMT